MIKEHYAIETQEMTLSIAQSRVSSMRSKTIRKEALRLYHNGHIAVAGGLGKPDMAKLEKRASAFLKMNIPYAPEPMGPRKEHRDNPAQIPVRENFLSEVEEVLEKLRESQPDFIFSYLARLRKTETSLRNDRGLDLRDTSRMMEFALGIKEQSSPNIMDGFSEIEGTRWDAPEFLRLTNDICEAMKNPMNMTGGTRPVLFLENDLGYKIKFLQELQGLQFGSGGSKWSSKIGEKLFHRDFTLYQSRNRADGFLEAFFDSEGVANPDDRFALIENGVLVAPYLNREYAMQFGLPQTGCAGGDFDETPGISMPHLAIKPGTRTTRDILGGEPGVVVVIASGGDFTPDGAFASPVQLALYYDGERFIGRCPEFKLSGHVNHMFGDGFMGVSSDSLTSLAPRPLIAMEMKVET